VIGWLEITVGLGLSIDAFFVAAAVPAGRHRDGKSTSPKFGILFGMTAALATWTGWLIPASVIQQSSGAVDLISGLIVYGIGLIWACKSANETPDDGNVSAEPRHGSISVLYIFVLALLSSFDAFAAGSLFGCQRLPILGLATAVAVCSGIAAMLGRCTRDKISSIAHPLLTSSGGLGLMVLASYMILD